MGNILRPAWSRRIKGAWGMVVWSLRHFLVAAVAGPSVLAVGACSSGSSYMSIPLADPAWAAPGTEVRELAQRAQAGDKQAQLDLGIAFEEGRGVPRDLGKARRLYRLAAADSGGRTWVYSPPVRTGERGRVI